MPKIIIQDYDTRKFHEHYCPGCECMHKIAVTQPFSNGAQWTFNGDMEKPTFQPSISCNPGTVHACHYFLHGGVLNFLPDCKHKFAGRMVELPEIPNAYLS
jgi:hypothetical protein